MSLARGPVRGGATATRGRAVRRAEVVAVSMSKIANDLALMGFGPAGRDRRVLCPRSEEATRSLGQGQQVIPSRDAGLAHRDRQDAGGHVPAGPRASSSSNVRGADLPPTCSIDRASSASPRACSGRSASKGRGEPRGHRRSRMTLAAARAQTQHRYDTRGDVTEAPNRSAAQGGRARAGVDEETYEKAMDLRKMAQGNLMSAFSVPTVCSLRGESRSGAATARGSSLPGHNPRWWQSGAERVRVAKDFHGRCRSRCDDERQFNAGRLVGAVGDQTLRAGVRC